jgi:hypothetical protein
MTMLGVVAWCGRTAQRWWWNPVDPMVLESKAVGDEGANERRSSVECEDVAEQRLPHCPRRWRRSCGRELLLD